MSQPQTNTDYDLPTDYDRRVAEGTMSRWYTQERCRRQAARQAFGSYQKYMEIVERLERRADAQAETVTLEDYR